MACDFFAEIVISAPESERSLKSPRSSRWSTGIVRADYCTANRCRLPIGVASCEWRVEKESCEWRVASCEGCALPVAGGPCRIAEQHRRSTRHKVQTTPPAQLAT